MSLRCKTQGGHLVGCAECPARVLLEEQISARVAALLSWQARAVKDSEETIAPAPPSPEARLTILDTDKAE